MLIWHDPAWEDYLYWQANDKRRFKRVNALIKEIQRTPFEGTGKPERLKGDLATWWSRRIDQEHRLVYRIEHGNVEILMCRGHYE